MEDVEQIFIPVGKRSIAMHKVTGGTRRAILVIGQSSRHARLLHQLQHTAGKDATLYMCEVRQVSMEEIRDDITSALELLRSFHSVFVVAFGRAASVMLEREERRAFDPLHGVVLIEPVFELHVRRLLRTRVAYRLPPVRVQTPAAIFSNDDGVHRIFGQVRIRAWHPRTDLEAAHTIISALRELYRTERPIRFPMDR